MQITAIPSHMLADTIMSSEMAEGEEEEVKKAAVKGKKKGKTIG